MKILICGDSMGIGGAETHILSLSTELDRLGHDVTVAAKRGVLRASLPDSVRFIDLNAGSPGGIFQLHGIIKEGNFNIVHAHSRWTSFAVGICKKSLPYSKFGFVVTAHALYKANTFKDIFSIWGDATIAVSKDIMAMLSCRYSVPREAVTFIPNGIDTTFFSPHPVTHSGHNMLFASRLDDDCSLGAELLCRMLPRLCRLFPDTTLTIAGGGSRLNDIRNIVMKINKKLGRSAARAVGAVSDISKLIAQSDCVVGVSRLALEAAAMKKNVILFGNEGGLGLLCRKNWRHAADTNFTARGFGVKDADFLAGEIISLFGMTDGERDDNSSFCMKRVISEYSISTATQRTLVVYQKARHSTTILLGGYYGFGNLGDETVKKALTASIHHTLPYTRILTLVKKPHSPGEICRHSPTAVVSAMMHSDIYLNGGGSLFQDLTSLRSVAYYCALVSLARMLGCRPVVIAGGIGPLSRPISRAMVRSALCKCHHISLRDKISRETVSNLTLGRKRGYLSADPAFSELLPISTGVDRIAISLRNESLLELSAVRRLPYVPIFIAMDSTNDRGLSPIDLRHGGDMLKSCGAAVGSRLHFLIMALLCKVPFAPIGSDPKISAFSKMTLGVPAIDPDKFPTADALSAEMTKYLDLCRIFYANGGRERVIARQKRLYERDIERFALFCRRVTQENIKK